MKPGKQLLLAVGVVVMGSTVSASALAMGKKKGIAQFGAIHVDESVSKVQAERLVADLALLSAWPGGAEPDPEFKTHFGLERAQGPALLKWLEERVSSITGDGLDLRSKVYVSDRSPDFPNRGMPILEEPVRVPSPTQPDGTPRKVMTVMSNTGAVLYYSGKKSGVYLGVDLASIGKVEIRSPRSGIIRVGEGLFSNSSTPTEMASPGATLFRLGILFHEARHSDGNGKTLGFFHAVCPDGHDYAGFQACDRNLNGPYTVGAVAARALLASCGQCSETEKAKAALKVLDSFNRVIKTTPTERGVLESLATALSVCEGGARITGTSSTSTCSDERSALEKAARGVSSVAWDPRPEGSR